MKKQFIDDSTDLAQMLELSDKDLKVAMIEKLH
jgi:hypothetical protein